MNKRHIGYAVKSLGRRINLAVDNIPAIKENKILTGIHVWILNFLFRNADRDVFQRDIEAEFQIRRFYGERSFAGDGGRRFALPRTCGL